MDATGRLIQKQAALQAVGNSDVRQRRHAVRSTFNEDIWCCQNRFYVSSHFERCLGAQRWLVTLEFGPNRGLGRVGPDPEPARKPGGIAIFVSCASKCLNIKAVGAVEQSGWVVIMPDPGCLKAFVPEDFCGCHPK